MIILSNSCLGGNLYKHFLKSEYKSVFVWNAIRYIDFFEIASKFPNIDLSIKNLGIQDDSFAFVRLKNDMKILFTHYHISENSDIVQDGEDVFSKDILLYTKAKYLSRYKRMEDAIKRKEDKILAFQDTMFEFEPKKYGPISENLVLKLLGLEGYKKKIIMTRYKALEKLSNDNVMIKGIDAHIPPMTFLNEHKTEIKEFLNC